MTAIALLRDTHLEILSLLDQLAATAPDDHEAERSAFLQLSRTITAQIRVERDLFFPACKRRAIDDDLAQLQAELTLSALHDASSALGTEAFRFELASLRDALVKAASHQGESLFPRVEATFLPLELVDLGSKMHAELIDETNTHHTPAVRAAPRPASRHPPHA